MIVPIKKGMPVVTVNSLEKIRTLDPEYLRKLYNHTNDPVQKVLIEEIYKLKGYADPFVPPVDEPPLECA